MTDKEKKEKEEALARIIKDKSNVVRLVPGPTYRDKMQTIRSNKVDGSIQDRLRQMSPLLPNVRVVGDWHT